MAVVAVVVVVVAVVVVAVVVVAVAVVVVVHCDQAVPALVDGQVFQSRPDDAESCLSWAGLNWPKIK